MKLLYVSPVGIQIDLHDRSTTVGHATVNFEPVRKHIFNSLVDYFLDDLIEEAANVYQRADQISVDVIEQYDVLVCDLSSSHGGAMFSAGIAEALHKPVIYIISEECRLPAILRSRAHLTYLASLISKDFLDELNTQVQLARDSPKAFLQRLPNKPAPKAFISYCHKDRHYLDISSSP